MKDLLPIGSVVMLKEATKSLMIVGTMQQDEEGHEYDYIAVVFPEGYINAETFFLFDNEDIVDVKFVGYINAESQVYAQILRNNELSSEAEVEN